MRFDSFLPTFRGFLPVTMSLALGLTACGPRGLGTGTTPQFGAQAGADKGRNEDRILNRIFRDSPAGEPPTFDPVPQGDPQEKPRKKEKTEPPVEQKPKPKPAPAPKVPRVPVPHLPLPKKEPEPPKPEPQERPQKQERKAPRPRHAKPETQFRGYWEGRVQQGPTWTRYAVQALDTHGDELLRRTPADIDDFCPRYPKLNRAERADFWVKLLSAVAAAESAYRPSASYEENLIDRKGNAVVSRGLLQISFESSRSYDCGFTSDMQLNDPQRNIACGVRIFNRLVSRDGVISHFENGRWRGAARYWSTLRTSSKRFKNIRRLLKEDPRCR